MIRWIDGAWKIGKGFASGLNYWKLGAYAVALAAIVSISYGRGHHNAELACQQEKTTAAEKSAAVLTQYVYERAPEVAKDNNKTQVIRDTVKEHGDAYEKALEARTVAADCDLSDAERLQWNALTAPTR